MLVAGDEVGGSVSGECDQVVVTGVGRRDRRRAGWVVGKGRVVGQPSVKRVGLLRGKSLAGVGVRDGAGEFGEEQW